MRLGGIARGFVACVVGLLAVGLVSQTARAAAAPPHGRVFTAVQNTFLHTLRVTGWAYDPARPSASVTVRVYVDGSYVGSTRADGPSPDVDSYHHISGDHRYALTVSHAAVARQVTVKTTGVRASAPLTTVGGYPVTHYYPPAGTRIIAIAKKYVGYPYVEGGSTPSGFDCSGYTRYSYGQAHVKTLVHNAESQRRSMRLISRPRARPGDLVFYMSGGSAYHVAIYAGHGWQYAAATARDGVRYQQVWSSNVQYGTDWH
jgi:cell wall-associated NlpC family hydrolase